VYDTADGYPLALGIENGTLGFLIDENRGQGPTGTPRTEAFLGDGITFLTSATASCPSQACVSLLDGQTVDLTLNATLVHTFGYPGQPPVDQGGILNTDPTHPFDPPDSTATASNVSFSYVAPNGWTIPNGTYMPVSCASRSGFPESCASTARVMTLSDGRTQYT
jgi:hypothetical protein